MTLKSHYYFEVFYHSNQNAGGIEESGVIPEIARKAQKQAQGSEIWLWSCSEHELSGHEMMVQTRFNPLLVT